CSASPYHLRNVALACMAASRSPSWCSCRAGSSEPRFRGDELLFSRGNHEAEGAENDLLDPKHQLPATIARNEEKVRAGFWKKMVRVASKVHFAEDAAAAWFCARDPRTPTRVRATLLAALAYFVTPADLIPDFVVVFGF